MTDEGLPLILYVEDDAGILELGVAALKDGGFRVQPVQSGAAAMRELETPNAAIRVLVTDIDLPGGANGWEVAQRARELFPDVGVVYVSGASAHEWGSKGVPGSVMLGKPFALAQLVVAVSNATLGPHSGAPTNA